MSTSNRHLAETLIETARNHFGQGCNLVPVELEKFRHLKLEGYRRFRHSVEKRQFRWLGELEFTQISQAPDSVVAPTAISCFVCPEAVMLAWMYQTGPNKANVIRQWFRDIRNLRPIAATQVARKLWKTRDHYEFSTEFDDGTRIITSLDSPAKQVELPPKFAQEFLPEDTSPSALLRHHRERVRNRIRDGSAQPVRAWSVGDVIESFRRFHDQKWKYRMQTGFYSMKELVALANDNETLAKEISSEIRQIMLEDPELARFLVRSPDTGIASPAPQAPAHPGMTAPEREAELA